MKHLGLLLSEQCINVLLLDATSMNELPPCNVCSIFRCSMNELPPCNICSTFRCRMNELPPCNVCGGKGSGLHYGVITCTSCKVSNYVVLSMIFSVLTCRYFFWWETRYMNSYIIYWWSFLVIKGKGKGYNV
jgi:hypothetical protein